MRPERFSIHAPGPDSDASQQAARQSHGFEVDHWLWTVGTGIAVLIVLWQSARLLRSGGRSFEMDFALALRSGAVFLLIIFPLTQPSLRDVAENIQAVYIWLPLWYMSSLRKSIGGWIQIFTDAGLGTLLGAAVILGLDKAMPRASSYSEPVCLIAAAAVGYVVCLSRLSTDIKQFFFGTLSPLLVMYMSQARFQPLVVEEHNIKWTSILLCYLYLTFAALALSAFTLLLRMPYCLSSSLLASTNCAADLADIAQDTWRGLQLLLKYFQSRPSDFDLETLRAHLELLRARTLRLEVSLSREAQWEVVTAFRWQLVRRLRCLLQLLTRQQLVMLAALAWLQAAPEAGHGQSPFLQEFETAAGAVLRTVTAPWWLFQALEEKEASVIDSLEHSELADAALLACLEAFREPDAEGRPETTSPGVMQPSAAFVEKLREIPRVMKDFLLDKDAEFPSEAQWLSSKPWLERSYHRQALVYVSAWVASLVWCVRFRSGVATCAILVAWLLPFSWVTLSNTLSEVLGTTGGVILGSLPSFAMRFSPSFRKHPGQPGPHEMFICFAIMYLLWTLATYYSQVQAFQWRVAALFWSCFGGVEMLRDFGLAEDFRSYMWKQRSWDTLVDLSFGCGLVFSLELVMGVLCRELSAKLRVAKACSECLKLVAVIAGTFQDSDGYLMRGQAAEMLSRATRQQEQLQELACTLSRAVIEARFWNSESRSCIRWDMQHMAMVDRILDQCDAVLLATRAVAWSCDRFGGPGPTALLMKGLVPEELPKRLHSCSEVVLVALSGETWALPEAPLPFSPALGEGRMELSAAAAAAAMRGSVRVMCEALSHIEAAIRAQEVLTFASWQPKAKKARGSSETIARGSAGSLGSNASA